MKGRDRAVPRSHGALSVRYMAAATKSQAKNDQTATTQAMMPWVLITEIYWMSYKLLERRFYHLGVSASQARVLAVLHFAKEPIKPSLVATLLFQETQSITGILHRIESRGWVTRLPDPNDRRAVGLQLTEEGRKITEEIIKISKELYNDMFGSVLNATEKRQIESALKKVRALGFKMPETDFKLRRAQQYPVWKD
jgi:MarR family multiple antibiotic resistance transcriptional regulator